MARSMARSTVRPSMRPTTAFQAIPYRLSWQRRLVLGLATLAAAIGLWYLLDRQSRPIEAMPDCDERSTDCSTSPTIIDRAPTWKPARSS